MRNQRDHSRSRNRERGASLVATLMVVSLISLIAVSLATDMRFSARRSINMEVRDQAHWYALGARDYAESLVARLVEAPDTAFRPDAAWLDGPQIFPIEDGQLAGHIRDGNNCFNLNALVVVDEQGYRQVVPEERRRLEVLMQAIGLPGNLSVQISAEVADWIDTDSRPIGGGAEDTSYDRLQRPRRPGNTLMVEREEMLALRSMTPRAYEQIEPFVCTRPNTDPLPINLNTLSLDDVPLMRAALGGQMSRAVAETVLSKRPPDGFEAVTEFWQMEEIQALGLDSSLQARFAVTTQYFEIDIDVLYSGQRYRLSEVIEARAGSEPIRLTQRYGIFS